MGCGARVPFSRRFAMFLTEGMTQSYRIGFRSVSYIFFGKKLAEILTVIKILDYLLIFVEIRSVSTESVMKANKIKIHIFIRRQIN